MYRRLTALVLRLLRVPPEPPPPHGDPASLRVFRAGRNYFHLRLVRWGVAQALALAGILFWLAVFIDVELEAARRQSSPRAQVEPHRSRNLNGIIREASGAAGETSVQAPSSASPAEKDRKAKKQRIRFVGLAGFKLMLVETVLRLPPWALPVLWVLKLAGLAAYLAQLPVTYLIARLDYELRWYMVTDRSLRIRHGVWKINESTMSFANIQQVVVSQGPLQRLLGLGDVRVQSAGGGGDREHGPGTEEDMHHGLFHSVTNSTEIRDLILGRLRRFRESGLGDPDEKPVPSEAVPAGPDEVLASARELLAEARALRSTLA